MPLPQFVTVGVGEADAVAAGTNGPFIHVGGIRAGDASGYTPLHSDTDLHGSEVYAGPLASGSYIGHNTWRALYQFPQALVFDYGELGALTADGTLLALVAYAGLQAKSAIQMVEIGVNYVISSQVVTKTDVQVEYDRAHLVEVYDLSLLLLPSAEPYNRYHVHSYTENGALALSAVEKPSEDVWDFHSHFIPITVADGAVTAGSTTTSIHTSTDLTGTLRLMPAGKYLLQFTSGALQGQCCYVTGATSTTITPDAALSDAPAAADTFRVVQSITSRLQDRLVIQPNAAGVAVQQYHNRQVVALTSGASDTPLPDLGTVPGHFCVTFCNHTGADLDVVPFAGQTIVGQGVLPGAAITIRADGGQAEFAYLDATSWLCLMYKNDWE